MALTGTKPPETTIEWAMAEFLKSPCKMKKAQAEVRQIVGKKSNVHEEDIKQMKYLKCVIKETLRLHPPAPLLIPLESIKCTQIKGYNILPKTRVYVNAWAIQRDVCYGTKQKSSFPKDLLKVPLILKDKISNLFPLAQGEGVAQECHLALQWWSLHSLTSFIALIGICPMER
ncbi:hypothetical protein Sjap_005972 [Stephania japonica]|uniref:Cytochrome P450 n=1 Tax=Stephania japonica TaxID=461633 RepID=A0AAP0K6K6_9MAGN